ncbi:pYEATS domain-containing protein [Rhizobium sp. BR 315]|uniref:pYEATS domain-containing protein n=1 Tax=Rhizobium sp. BR 315 TaxID=3040014 RepID=UPI003D33EC54
MKTTLYLEAPADLSIGTVRISNESGTLKEWTATPEDRVFTSDEIRPGSYLVEISPAGVAAQSVIFDVEEGKANTVTLPYFSALSSMGSNTAFLSAGSEVRANFDREQTVFFGMEPSVLVTLPVSTRTEKLATDDADFKERKLSVGLSQEKSGKKESFGPFSGHSRAELAGSRLEISLFDDEASSAWHVSRVRISIAIEGSRVERALVPLYRGGTTISITPSALSSADVSLEIVPADPMLRALVRALHAGVSEEAQVIRDKVLPKLRPLSDDGLSEDDPWSAILFGLLSTRFPDTFGAANGDWTVKLADRAIFAFDAQVIAAHYAIMQAGSTGQEKAVKTAVQRLAKAQAAGSPYYAYADELFAELISGLNELRIAEKISDPEVAKTVHRMFSRYQRELSLQKKSGATFVWFRRDQEALRNGLLVPDRKSSGLLRRPDTSIIFEGRIAAGRVSLGNGQGRQKSSRRRHLVGDVAFSPPFGDRSFEECPALSREPGPRNDPNKGRFGGQAAMAGFSVTATFARTDDEDWTKINLIVEAEQSIDIALGDSVWLFLHPTFSPAQLKVLFRGRRAVLSTEAYGGFTVGVWIPKYKVELELNLAELSLAPSIIRNR